ncbi:DUF7289 family protein [Halorussus salinus]|uniref:DUF7289 family protein n=1 Tax=Halorussus salinus TaxID=1364935 RepID=UPI0010928DB2|nr:hypothetical protein [Halorussus salinus]
MCIELYYIFINYAQSNVVGVAILLGVVVVALGSLTAGIGVIVEENAAAADSARVAADFDAALDPVEATGVHRGRVSFTDGELQTKERDLRVLNESGTLRTVRTDALVFTAGDRRVAFLAGAIVRGPPDNAKVRTPPPITLSRNAPATDASNADDADPPGVLVVGAPALNGSVAVSGSGGASVALRTEVSHRRSLLGNGTYRVAIETATPEAWRRHFERRNASVTTRDFDGDGVTSVVAAYPGERVAYLVVHEMDVEVRNG